MSFSVRRSCPGRRSRAPGSRRRAALRRSPLRGGRNLPKGAGGEVEIKTQRGRRQGPGCTYLEDGFRRRVPRRRLVPGDEGVGHVHCHLAMGSVVARQHHHHVVVQVVVQLVWRLLHGVQVAVQHDDARTGASSWPGKPTLNLVVFY